LAIEFSCPHCEHRLRTSDDKAGLSAKCPACGEMIWVPYSQAAASADARTTQPVVPPPIPDDPLGEPFPPVEAGGTTRGAEAPGQPLPSQDDKILEDAFEPPPRRRIVAADVVCPGCQASNDAGARECRFCGTSLEGVEPRASERIWSPPRFDVSEIMSASWRIYTQEIGLLIGSMLLMMLYGLVLGAVIAVPIVLLAITLKDDALLVLIPLGIVGFPIMILMGVALQIGQTRLFLNVARGSGAGIGDLLYGFGDGRRFILRGVLVSITVTGMMLLGMLLCCAPAILVMLTCWPALPLLLDRDPPGGTVVGEAIELVKQRMGDVLAIGAIGMGIQIAAGIIPYLGVIIQLFAVPFTMLLFMLGYLRMTEQKTAVD
jgi:hypothetical protein